MEHLSLLIFSRMCSIEPYWRISFKAVTPPIPEKQNTAYIKRPDIDEAVIYTQQLEGRVGVKEGKREISLGRRGICHM